MIQSCGANDPNTGLHCMRELDHHGLHLVEIEWADDEDEVNHGRYRSLVQRL